jgi:hypothetical protein
MGIMYLAARPPYQARHRRHRRLGDPAAVFCYGAAAVLGALLVTVAPALVLR